MTEQDRLQDFVDDPSTIAKAAEGSMDKRNAVLAEQLEEAAKKANVMQRKLVADEELRDKLRALPRTSRTDPRYPIDAYEDDLVKLITQYADQQVNEVLDRLESQTNQYVSGGTAMFHGEPHVPLSAIDNERRKV